MKNENHVVEKTSSVQCLQCVRIVYCVMRREKPMHLVRLESAASSVEATYPAASTAGFEGLCALCDKI
jgi:hypothetical protein